MAVEQAVARHYMHGDLGNVILAALAAAGKDLDRLRPEDLAPVDEFHVRGREATVELGARLGLQEAMHVLDVGSGLGGPSRHLAGAYGCRVTGLDLTSEYCAVAALLAERVGLADRVEYRQCDALAMPFADGTFDAAITQHAAMNIGDKARLYAEVSRVLKPGSVFGLYDLLQGAGGEVHYPVPWARDPSTSFLVGAGELRVLLEGAGFEIVGWRDLSAEGLAWFENMRQKASVEGLPPVGVYLLFADFPEMSKNMVRNLAEGRVAPTEVICRRS